MRTSGKKSRPAARLGLTRLDDRITPTGLDPAFGGDGVAVIDLGGNETLTAAAVAPDGRIVALGNRDFNGPAVDYFVTGVVTRVNADGTPDATFGTAGVVVLPRPGSFGSYGFGTNPAGGAVAVDAAGRIVVAVNYTESGAIRLPLFPEYSIPSLARVSITRLNPDGSLDTTFAGDGTADIALPGDGQGFQGMALLADGSIVFAGAKYRDYSRDTSTFPNSGDLPPNPDVVVFKVTPAGAIDATFGTAGVATIDPGTGAAGDVRVAALSDGGILVFGNVYADVPEPGGVIGFVAVPSGSRVFAARLTAAGAADAAYGTAGVFRSAGNSTGNAYEGIAAAADGGLFYVATSGVIYTSLPPQYPAPQLLHVTPTGAMDATFAGDGALELVSPYLVVDQVQPAGPYLAGYGFSLTPEPDGGVLLTAAKPVGLVLIRATAAGEIDATFGTAGTLVIPNTAAGVKSVTPAVVLPDGAGGFVISGWANDQAGFVNLLPPQVPPPPPQPAQIVGLTGDTTAPPPGDVIPPFEAVRNDLWFARLSAAVPTPANPPAPARIDYPRPEVHRGAIVKPAIAIIPPAGGTGGLLTDVTGDGVADVITVTGNTLSVTDGVTGVAVVSGYRPFEASFTGGIVTAAADLNADGKAEIVVAPDVGGSGRVQVLTWTGTALAVTDDFFAIDDVNFRGGARIAAGDVNGDGRPDLVVGAGPGGGPRVAVFDGNGLMAQSLARPRLVADFFAFPGEDSTRLRDGVTVTAADVNGDGKADLTFGAGPGGAPRVFVLDGATIAAGRSADAQNSPLANFYSGDATARNGVAVAVTDTNSDGVYEITTLNRTTGEYRSYAFGGLNGSPGEPAFEAPGGVRVVRVPGMY